MGRSLQSWKATRQPRARHSGSIVCAGDHAVSSPSASGRPSGLVEVDPRRATSRVPTGTGGLNGDNLDRTGFCGAHHTSSMVGDTAGNLWLINDVQGLFHVREGRVVEQMPWATLALKGPATALLLDPLQGGVWLGFDGGVAHVKDGQVRASYAIADGELENRVSHLRLDDDGTLWAATERGLSRAKDGHVVTLASKIGVP